MKLDTYHRYAAFFDAARALPGWQYIRVSGEAAGEAYRQWCAANGLEVVESTLERNKDGRRVEWGTLESPGVSVGVHLDDRPSLAPDPAPAPIDPQPHTPIDPEVDPEVAF
ncbi:MAG: hypothetical protein ACM358_05660 [Gemmatimonadota bacterium]